MLRGSISTQYVSYRLKFAPPCLPCLSSFAPTHSSAVRAQLRPFPNKSHALGATRLSIFITTVDATHPSPISARLPLARLVFITLRLPKRARPEEAGCIAGKSNAMWGSLRPRLRDSKYPEAHHAAHRGTRQICCLRSHSYLHCLRDWWRISIAPYWRLPPTAFINVGNIAPTSRYQPSSRRMMGRQKTGM
ncbi:hypothetical protein FB567DRAFT_236219 [Paraphoma chrysanthemicola]|uniref:Uncharacterized protein n=1 Tax=Paraphoma chrysanthemicola TaxID=798071 RepID=A0A8K0RDG0_9PLEO|nr:hypothetical protein FB567DRAFT_236219 [Paraphoma chrysanthemicola]